jgi:hypothetical protein
MTHALLRLMAAISLVGMLPVPGLTQAGEKAQPAPARVSVCEILRAPLEYNGRFVTIRGRMGTTPEGRWLVAGDCPGLLTTGDHVWPSEIWLALPGGHLILHPIHFQFDEQSSRKFERRYKQLARRVPQGCIVATLTGIFETREDWSLVKMVYRNGSSQYAGFGHMGEAPGQLVTKSEDEVAADPNCGAKQNTGRH